MVWAPLLTRPPFPLSLSLPPPRTAQHDIDAFRGCLSRGSSARECGRKLFYGAQQLVKGLYALSIPDWMEVYDNSTMMVFRTEDYSADMRGHATRVLDFLGVPVPPPDVLDLALEGRYNEGAEPRPNVPGCDGKRKPMLPETRRLVQDFYDPYNRELAQLLGDPRYIW